VKAFDEAFNPEKRGAPIPMEDFDADSFDPNAPEDLKSVKVHVIGGENISLEESDSKEYTYQEPSNSNETVVDAPETPLQAQTPPPVDKVPVKALPPVESPILTQEIAPFTKEQSLKVVEALIDGLNVIYRITHPLNGAKPKKLKLDQIELLKGRVLRGRQLVAQLEKEISKKPQ